MTSIYQRKRSRQIMRITLALLECSICFAVSFCSSLLYAQRAPLTPNARWLAEGAADAEVTVVTPREITLDTDRVYSLGDLIDIAESNNPHTRAAWNRAKLSAASVGIAKSELYPTVLATATGTTFSNPTLLNQSFVVQDLGLFESALRVDYTLIDFGARRANILASQARLIASNLSFNNEHLNVIYRVSRAYYRLLDATGLRRASEVSLSDARALQAAAQDRRGHGLATVPDVLEAEAAAAQANYELQNAIGVERLAYGNLAKEVTASPVRRFKVQQLDELQIPETLSQKVEEEISSAFRSRPDLRAKEAQVRALKAELSQTRSAYYPTLGFSGSRGWLRGWGRQAPFAGTYAATWTFDATITLRWTIFDGFRRESRIAEARANEAAAIEDVHVQQDEIANQMWTEYTNAQTALEKRHAANSLLSAATESYAAATESYKYGVRNFLDVLAAENALSQARAVEVTARAQVLSAFTDLAFRTGALLTTYPKGNNQ